MNWLYFIFLIGQLFLSLALTCFLITTVINHIVVYRNKNTEKFDKIIDKIQELNVSLFIIGGFISLGVVFRVMDYILN
jgi:uncharacterized membrane protein